MLPEPIFFAISLTKRWGSAAHSEPHAADRIHPRTMPIKEVMARVYPMVVTVSRKGERPGGQVPGLCSSAMVGADHGSIKEEVGDRGSLYQIGGPVSSRGEQFCKTLTYFGDLCPNLSQLTCRLPCTADQKFGELG